MSGACGEPDMDGHNEDEAFFEEVNCHRDYHIQQSLSSSFSDQISLGVLKKHQEGIDAESPVPGLKGDGSAKTLTRKDGGVTQSVGDKHAPDTIRLDSSTDDLFIQCSRTLPHSSPPAESSREMTNKQGSIGGQVTECISRGRVHISVAPEYGDPQADVEGSKPEYQVEQAPSTGSGVFSLNLDKAFAQRLRTINIQRGTEAPDDEIDLVPIAGEDLMQHVRRLSTRIQTQEAEKRTMAEESFQLEQLLKKKYHEDIFAKTQECKELQRNNATLLRQLQITQTECQELREAFSQIDGVIDGIFLRTARALVQTPSDDSERSGPFFESTTRIISLCEVLRGAYQSHGFGVQSDGANALRKKIDRMLHDCRETLIGSKSASAISAAPVLDDSECGVKKMAAPPTQACSASHELDAYGVGHQVQAITHTSEFETNKSFATPAGFSAVHPGKSHDNVAKEKASHDLDAVVVRSSRVYGTLLSTREEVESKQQGCSDDMRSAALMRKPAEKSTLDDFTFLDTHFPEKGDAQNVQSLERGHDLLPVEKLQRHPTTPRKYTCRARCHIRSPHDSLRRIDESAFVRGTGSVERVDKFTLDQNNFDARSLAMATKPLWQSCDHREGISEVGFSCQPNHVLPARQKVVKRDVSQRCPSSTLPWTSCILGRACSVGSLHGDSKAKFPVPSEGIRLPPLHQRKLTDDETVQRCGRRRSSSLTVSASAKSLLPVLRPKDRGTEGVSLHGFVGASRDLSVVGRTLIPGRLCCGRAYAVGHQSKLANCNSAFPASLHSPADQNRTVSGNRSISTNPKRVFSRTRRSVSPVERRGKPEVRCITSESLRIESRLKNAEDANEICDENAMRRSLISCNHIVLVNKHRTQMSTAEQHRDDSLKHHWCSGLNAPSQDVVRGKRAGEKGTKCSTQLQSPPRPGVKVKDLTDSGPNSGDQGVGSPTWPVFVMNPDGCSVQGRCSDYAALMSREECQSSPVAGITGCPNQRRAPNMVSVVPPLVEKKTSTCSNLKMDDTGCRVSLVSRDGILQSNGISSLAAVPGSDLGGTSRYHHVASPEAGEKLQSNQTRVHGAASHTTARWCLSPRSMPEDSSAATSLGRRYVEMDKNDTLGSVAPISIAPQKSPVLRNAQLYIVQAPSQRFSGEVPSHSRKVRSVCPELPDMRSAHVVL